MYIVIAKEIIHRFPTSEKIPWKWRGLNLLSGNLKSVPETNFLLTKITLFPEDMCNIICHNWFYLFSHGIHDRYAMIVNVLTDLWELCWLFGESLWCPLGLVWTENNTWDELVGAKIKMMVTLPWGGHLSAHRSGEIYFPICFIVRETGGPT